MQSTKMSATFNAIEMIYGVLSTALSQFFHSMATLTENPFYFKP